MNLFRRILSVLAVAVLVAVVGYGLFWMNNRSRENMDPDKAIPAGFSVCLKINDFKSFEDLVKVNSQVWNELAGNKLFWAKDKFNHFLAYFDSLRSVNPQIESFYEGRLYFSFYHSGISGPELIISKACRNHHATDEWLKIMESEGSLTRRKFEGQTYYNFELAGKSQNIRLAFFETGGILVISSSEELLKQAVLSLKSDNISIASGIFSKLIKTEGNDVPANLYINYAELDSLSSGIFRKDIDFRLSEWFSASVLDLEIHSDKIIINGFTNFNQIDKPFYLSFTRPENSFQLLSVLPSNLAAFDLIKGSPALINSVSQSIVPPGLKELFSDESARILLKIREDFESLVVYNLNSGSSAEDYLKATPLAQVPEGAVLEPHELKMDNQVFRIYDFQGNKLQTCLANHQAGSEKYAFFTVFNNLLILAESQEGIKDFLYSNILGRTLENNVDFKRMSENFSSSSNRFAYVNTGIFFRHLEDIVSDETRERLQSGKSGLLKFDALSFQSTRSEDLNYFRIFMHYSGEISEAVSTVWERKLDTISEYKPRILKNHLTGEKEIFLQDLKNNIYLINNSGNILWKLKLDGPILGEVFQVDYYRNGKLQIFFNTPAKIYLLDRNGNPVEKFPVNLREEASSGMNLFDYDRNGDWRIPVPCKDRKIYMYDKEGRIITGWEFKPGDQAVNQPLMHIRSGEKDFIVAKEEYQVHFLDRKGNIRIKPQQQIHFSDNPLYLDGTETKACLYASSRTGAVYRFFLDGRVDCLFENNASENHYFLADDINGDRKFEFIFIDGSNLLVYDSAKKLIFKQSLPDEITLPPVVYEFSARDKKIGVVATKTGKIYLFNNDGSQYGDFPLTGSSLFSISSFPGLKDRFNLIVSNKDNFLYNYSVQ